MALSVELRAAGSCGVSQTRYLHRERNRRSSRVRKYHSVPVLRLPPSDRPLFFCDKCCSANFYVPVCLWCKWTSAAAVKIFEEKIPRGRTLSTPGLCSAGPGYTRKKNRLRGAVALGKLEPRGSLDTDRSTEPPETPCSLSQNDESPAILAVGGWVKLSVDETILPTSLAQSFPDPYHGGQARNRKQRLSAAENNRKSVSSSSRSMQVPWSDGGVYESHSFSDVESEGFRRSTDSRRGGAKSEGHVSRIPHDPPRTRKPIVQSPSPSPSLNRRPLYHYIRSKATASQSTFDCGVVPELTITPRRYVTPHQGAGRHLDRQSTEAFPTPADELGFPTPVPPIMSFSRNGFSLSGETEQRMSLARMVHDGQFVFHENKPDRKRDRIMRGLRRSFKTFFNSKADR